MIIGIPKEIKAREYRVAMTPSGVEQMVARGHSVLVENDAGSGSSFTNEAYKQAGGVILESAGQIFEQSDMIMKVKEPLPAEYPLIRPGQIMFTYFHFAASIELTEALLASRCIAIAYETVSRKDGALPLLTPMSEIAGRMAVQEGARYLEKPYGGKGLLLGGVPGVEPGVVLVIGAGVVGTNAAKIACGMGARVYILDTNLDRLRYLSDVMPKNCTPLMSSPAVVRRLLSHTDLAVGAVLIPGAKAPYVISRDMLALMPRGSVIVDVAIDQGGCVETSRPTTHDDPVYEIDGILHYCVANMPGAVAITSTGALTNATFPYALQIADKGYRKAAEENPEIARGISMIEGRLTCPAVAEAFGITCEPASGIQSEIER
jgi:alanine dehydrogenase